MNHKVSQSDWWELALFPALCVHLAPLPLILLDFLSSTLGSFSTCMCWSVLGGILYRSSEFSHCKALSYECSVLQTLVTLVSWDTQLSHQSTQSPGFCLSFHLDTLTMASWLRSPLKIVSCMALIICSL